MIKVKTIDFIPRISSVAADEWLEYEEEEQVKDTSITYLCGGCHGHLV